MMRFGCGLIVLGFGLIVAGVIWVGAWMFDSWGPREVVRLDVPTGKPLVSEVVTLTPDSRCQLEVEATVHAEKGVLRSFKKEDTVVERYVPVFRFPVVARVTDEDGKELFNEAAALEGQTDDPDNADFLGVGPKGGTGTARVKLPLFTAPSSGKLRVEATFFPDEGNGARAEKPTVVVFDRLPPPAESTTVTFATPLAGIGVLIVGELVFVVGFFVWVIRLFTGPPRPRPSPVLVR